VVVDVGTPSLASVEGTGELGPREGFFPVTAVQARTCPVCGSGIESENPRQRYCEPCDGERMSRCRKRAMNHRQRAREGRKTIPLTAPLPAPYRCAECGKACIPGGSVPANATRFCGRKCKRDWHHAREAA
jgi:hypothetical protein